LQQLLLPTNEFISSNTTLICHIFILYSSRQYFYKILQTFFISFMIHRLAWNGLLCIFCRSSCKYLWQYSVLTK